jgi:hypothetical protein
VTIGKHAYRVFRDSVNLSMAPNQKHHLYRIFDATQHANEFGYIPAKDTVPIVYHPRIKQWRVADLRLRGGNPLATKQEMVSTRKKTFSVLHTTSIESADAQREAARRMLDPSQWQSNVETLASNRVYMEAYRQAFVELTYREQRALWNWSAAGGDKPYHFGAQPVEDGINFELNDALARGDLDWRNEPLLADTYFGLQTALPRLPATPQPATLLRVADVPASYRHRLAVGDIVTNAPLFMSASSRSEYAEMSIAEQGAANGDIADEHRSMLAFYSIKSLSAKPLVRDISAPSTVDHEAEYLFGIDSRFRVDAISIAEDLQGTEKPCAC